MSYMDGKSILSEGFFNSLKKYFKDRKNMSSAEKKLLKDPKFKKAYSDLAKARKELGLDK